MAITIDSQAIGWGMKQLLTLLLAMATMTTATDMYRPTVKQLGSIFGCDKVTSHSYHHFYDRYFPAFRNIPVNLLEIGLGCNYNLGSSLKVWQAYFTHRKTNISFVELDSQCATPYWNAFKHQTGGELFIGDQSAAPFLETVSNAGLQLGGYDLIIDDGSHNENHQIASFNGLWASLKPGGIYVIEDLEGSSILYDWLAVMHKKMNCAKKNLNETCWPDLFSINCYFEACLFFKKGESQLQQLKHKQV